MKIKVYIDRIPKGMKCRATKDVCRWYYSPARMCTLFDSPIDEYTKCDKCKRSEEVF